MSEIEALENIRGSISGKSTLSGMFQGSILGKPDLSGTLSVATGQVYDVYSGDHEVIPSVAEEQTLETANKLLSKDIVVTKVPYFETSNESNGKTIYIGKEV